MRFAGPHLRDLRRSAAIFVALGAALGFPASACAQSASSASGSAEHPVVLDSVVAVINGDVLLWSDVQDEMNLAALQPGTLPPGKNFERRAAQRLINRILILQQMKQQGMVINVSDEEVEKDLDDLRKQLPTCAAYHCETAEGWAKFLASHNLTSAEVQKRWRERMQILNFIDARFRAGIRISQTEMDEYYNKTLVPQFKAEQAPVPTLASISDRIEEILLQQHVNVLLQDWLKSLRDQGNVIILDPALGKSNPSPNDDDEGGAE